MRNLSRCEMLFRYNLQHRKIGPTHQFSEGEEGDKTTETYKAYQVYSQ